MFDVANLNVTKLEKVQPGDFVRFQDDTNWRFCFEYEEDGELGHYFLDFDVINEGYHCSGFGNVKIEGEGNRDALILSDFSVHAELASLNFNLALKNINCADFVIVGAKGPAFITLSRSTKRPIAIGRNGKVIDCPEAPVARFERWQIRAGAGGDESDIIYSWPVE